MNHSSTLPPPEGKVWIETYGCQMNVADTELMGGLLIKAGYHVARDLDEATVILLNTCAVREKAEERIYGRASQLLPYKYANPNVVLGITGCMAEHLKGRITERAPWIDLVIGPDAYRRLPELVKEARGDDPVIDVRLDKRETYEGLDPERSPGTSAFITIQRGCDKFCTFCIVPFTRGRERGTPPREVLRQARELVKLGYKEVSLLGQTVNSYRYEDVDFTDLLRSVASVDGLERIRYVSPYPIDFSPKLIEALATLPNVPPYLHLPLQSGSEEILSAMRRGYTLKEYRKIVQDLRAAIPHISISTDIIVGFPDESDDDFKRTLDAMEEFQFDSAFMFAYSEREGTYASKRIADNIEESVKKERLAELIQLQQGISEKAYGRFQDEVVEVLVEGPSKRGEGRWYGKSADFKTTVFEDSGDVEPGQLRRVRVTRTSPHSLYGKIEP